MTSLTQQKERERTAGRAWTPGPWIAVEWECDPRLNEDGNRYWGINPEKLHTGAQYLEASGWMTEANARLIAAAPELFEALATFVEEYCALVNSGDAGNWDPDQEPKVIAARSALQLARGEKGDE